LRHIEAWKQQISNLASKAFDLKYSGLPASDLLFISMQLNMLLGAVEMMYHKWQYQQKTPEQREQEKLDYLRDLWQGQMALKNRMESGPLTGPEPGEIPGPGKTAAVPSQDPYERFQQKLAPLNRIPMRLNQYFDSKRRQFDYQRMMSDPVARQQFTQWMQTNPEAKQAFEQWKAGTPQAQPAAPASPAPTQPKPMAAPCKMTPTMLALFDDEEEASEFIESLNEDELRIIEEHKDNPQVIHRLKIRVRDDIESTAKDLAIDE